MRRTNCETVADHILFIPHQTELADGTGAMVNEKPTICDYQAIQDKTDGHGIIIASELRENEGPDILDCVDKIVAEAQKDGLETKGLNFYVQDTEGWLQKVHLNEAKVDGEYPRSPVQREYVATEISPVKLEEPQQQTDPGQDNGLGTVVENSFTMDRQEFQKEHELNVALDKEMAFGKIKEMKEDYVQQQKDLDQEL